MNKRTFEIIARYISKELGIKVTYGNVPGPCITLKDKTIRLPEKIQEDNALAALSSLMHEAAHMRYTVVIPDDFSKTNVDHHIVNAIEDVRIDRHNFSLLPNVYEFYNKFYEDHICNKEYQEKLLKQHIFTRVIIAAILECEYFSASWDAKAMEFCRKHDIRSLFEDGIHAIEYEHWDDLRVVVDKIKNLFPDIKKDEKPVPKKGEPSGGECRPAKEGEKGEPGSGAPMGEGTEKEVSMGKAGDDNNDGAIGDPSEFMRPSSVWGKGDGLEGPGGNEFNQMELNEITRQKFKNALNITERVTLEDGIQLDTDNIMSYFTGDVEELFKEEEEIKTKNSKIVFCLDASGSMCSALMDNKMRKATLAGCVQSLVDILDEVKETESLNVDWDIVAFDGRPYLCDKDNWLNDYNSHNGSTNLLKAIQFCLDILDSPEVDGNKILIVVTDGCVGSGSIERTREMITETNAEIKVMILGIGANISTPNLNGNILVKEHAEQVLMEAIQTALEG
jgi:hypothetical protein